MNGSKPLGEFEHLVLLGVARLGEHGYGLRIRSEISRRTTRQPSIGAVYATLDRLEDKGYVTSTEGDPTPERGGRAKRLFCVSPEGARALASTRLQMESMWEGVDLPSRLKA